MSPAQRTDLPRHCIPRSSLNASMPVSITTTTAPMSTSRAVTGRSWARQGPLPHCPGAGVDRRAIVRIVVVC